MNAPNPSSSKKIQVAIADDHKLLRNGLVRLVSTFDKYNVIFEADNGRQIKEKLGEHIIPDIIILDVNMPDVDGFQTAQWLHKNFPQVKILALSMFSDENIIIRMLRLGAKGYILKNIEPEELKNALDSIVQKDFYLSEYISGKIISGLHKDQDGLNDQVVLTEKEKEFLKHACSELTYKDIAERMFVSHRTVDDYRNGLCEKLKVKTRVGLVMYAIKHGYAEI